MAKLGDNKKPVIVRVATEERAHEIYALCENNGWKVVIGIEPDKVKDISDVQRLLGMKVENIKQYITIRLLVATILVLVAVVKSIKNAVEGNKPLWINVG